MNKIQDGDGRVFYALGCTFWTEDWRRMGSNGNIPSCPNCGSVGFETSFSKFIEGAVNFDKKENGYLLFIIWLKNRCYKNITIAREIFRKFMELDELV